MKITKGDAVGVDLYSAEGLHQTDARGKYLGQMDEAHVIALDAGPLLHAHVAAGRFVWGVAAPAADGTEPDEAPLESDAREDVPAIGIFYLGPPNVSAQERLAKIFGPQARHITHARPTEAQCEAYARTEPRAALTVYVGTIPSASAKNIMKLSDILTAAADPLFPQIVSVLPDQIDEARANLSTGHELAALIVDDAAAAAV